MKKIQAHKTFQKIKLLSLATPRALKHIIREADKSLVDAVSECCLNVLKDHVPLTAKQKSRLARHKEKLRKFAERRAGVRKRKEILVQSGDGLISALLIPVAALLGRLLATNGTS